MVKINEKAIGNVEGKQMFLITEVWQGLSPATSYQDQAAAVARALDSVEYIERAIDRGDVVMSHKPDNQVATIQLVAVDSLDDLSTYIKSNEAHARLPSMNRTVQPLADWDKSVRDLDELVARAEVRARFEKQGLAQPRREELDSEVREALSKRSSE
ncbi:hypothetical protein ACQKGC_28280 [Allorhizobium pseudoryzae]|uniref:hypothetical protein n=1 Tax=Allorhizobium pseudoryzae TaxID=379684 RepID=UPI003CFCFBC6